MTGRFLLACIAALASAAASAQDYPAKPVRLVVGFAAGGPTDVIARVIAQDMAMSLGQGVVVENKTGANALIATQEVKRAAPDGYTILMTTLSHNVNAILLADQKPYDPIKDFAPISLVSFLPLVMVTRADAPFNSVQDVVQAAKAKPGEVSYASAGNGGSAHLAAALVETLSGTRMTHVPFRGNAPALTEVMAGRVSFMFYPMVGIADQVAQKRLKALAVSTEKRHPDYPAVLTMAESGFPGFEQYTQGLGVVAPAGTPAPVIDKLNAAVRASLAKPETKEKLKGLGGFFQTAR
ncbi:MAG: tripartite tricarboxylate transporter substrate binding protein [Betaproteobacteria bacterium]|nr:MAG: tripartite tricarboxylate transporter substrate binding protein [Betaproteobacteria bacterium]